MSEYYFEPRNVLPNGLTLLQINPDFAVELRQENAHYGWLFTRGPEKGQWVSMRKLDGRELEEAATQAGDSMVLRVVRVG